MDLHTGSRTLSFIGFWSPGALEAYEKYGISSKQKSHNQHSLSPAESTSFTSTIFFHQHHLLPPAWCSSPPPLFYPAGCILQCLLCIGRKIFMWTRHHGEFDILTGGQGHLFQFWFYYLLRRWFLGRDCYGASCFSSPGKCFSDGVMIIFHDHEWSSARIVIFCQDPRIILFCLDRHYLPGSVSSQQNFQGFPPCGASHGPASEGQQWSTVFYTQEAPVMKWESEELRDSSLRRRLPMEANAGCTILNCILYFLILVSGQVWARATVSAKARISCSAVLWHGPSWPWP